MTMDSFLKLLSLTLTFIIKRVVREFSEGVSKEFYSIQQLGIQRFQYSLYSYISLSKYRNHNE